MISDFGGSLRKAWPMAKYCRVAKSEISSGGGGSAKQQCSTGPGQPFMSQRQLLAVRYPLAISHSEHDPFMDDKSNYDLALASKDVHSHMCHGQNMFWFPIIGDGHATIDTDFDTHYMDSYCGMDDHTPYTMF